MMLVYWSRRLVCRFICSCTLILTLIEILLQPRRYNTFHHFCHSANYSLLERKNTRLITETQSTAYAGIQLSTDPEDRYYIAHTQKTTTRLILSIGPLYFWYTSNSADIDLRLLTGFCTSKWPWQSSKFWNFCQNSPAGCQFARASGNSVPKYLLTYRLVPGLFLFALSRENQLNLPTATRRAARLPGASKHES